MNLSKLLLVLPVSSLLVAAAVAAGACSSSTGITISSDTPPSTFVPPDGIVLGTTTCPANDYIVAGSDWLFCDSGVWEYTTTDPSGSYTLDTDVSGGDDAGSDANSPTEDGSTPGDDGGSDATSPTEDGSAPSDDGSTPADDGSAPSDDGSAPAGDAGADAGA